MKETKSHYRGLGTIQQQHQQVTQVFYSFDLEDPVRRPLRVLGVVITREILTHTEEVLLLKSEEGYVFS